MYFSAGQQGGDQMCVLSTLQWIGGEDSASTIGSQKKSRVLFILPKFRHLAITSPLINYILAGPFPGQASMICP